MKITAPFLLFLFVAFLSMPSIVTLIKKSSNAAVFYDIAEEDHVKKEGVDFIYTLFLEPTIVLQSIVVMAKIYFENFLKYDKILRIVFSPPPDKYLSH